MLQLFYSNPNRAFYVREITRKIDEQINSVRRELANLLSIGIISSDNNTDDNRLYYEVNQDYEYYTPLSVIFGGGVMKKPSKDGEGESQTTDIKTLGNVEIALLTGQFTRDDLAGVDFVIVGDVNPTKVSKYVAELEGQEGKELRYVMMTVEEFDYRRQIKDRFLSMVLASKMQVLLDKNYRITPKPKAEPKETKKKSAKEEE